MADYEKINSEEDPHVSQALLKNAGEEDTQSTTDESTILGNPTERSLWSECSRRKRRSVVTKVVISLLLSLLIISTAIVLLLAWLVVYEITSHNADTEGIQHDQARSQNLASSTGITSCGSTPTEANAAGCHFDIFSFGWNPPECTDMQLYNLTLSILHSQLEGSSAFAVRSATGSHPVDISVVQEYGFGAHGQLTGDQDILGTWEHYLVACAYGWQKVQRAAMRNWPLEEWSASYTLASRCGPDMLTREKREGDSIMLHLRPWYPKCGLEALDMRKEIAAALQ